MSQQIQTRLHAVVLNLAVLEAMKDYDKLRIMPNDPEAAPPSPMVSVEQSHLAIDERFLLQGTRRAMSGDGHATSIAFLRKLIEEVRLLANEAFAALNAPRESVSRTNLFEQPPRKMLHTLSCACVASKKGIDRLRQTTYADSQQVGVELSDINRDFDTIIANVAEVLLTEP